MEEVGEIVVVVTAGDTVAGGGVSEARLSVVVVVVVVVVVGKTEAGASDAAPDRLVLRGRPRPRFFSTLSPSLSSS